MEKSIQTAAALETPASRRTLLKSAAVLSGTLALSSSLAALAPGRAWALEMKALNARQGKVILAFTRQLYPHPTLDDAVYALVVKDLDTKASTDKATQTTLTQGVAQLDQIAGGDWLKRSAAMQEIDVGALQSTPFFKLVRSTAVVSLYSNEMAYAHFGYGGPAGNIGYLYKGFNDLAWLPAPPEAASGPIQKT